MRSGGPNTVGTVGVPCPSSAGASRSTAEEGGGLLLDLHTHLVDQAVLLHGEVESVYAEVDSRTTVAEDDTFLACRHTSGVVSHVMSSSVNGAPGPRARVNGSAGSFVIGRQFDDVSSFTEFENDGDAVGWIVRGDEREPGPVVTDADQANFYRAVAAALVVVGPAGDDARRPEGRRPRARRRRRRSDQCPRPSRRRGRDARPDPLSRSQPRACLRMPCGAPAVRVRVLAARDALRPSGACG